MALDPAYQSLHNAAVNLQNQMRNALGDSNASGAQNLRQQMQHLEDDVQGRKSPRDIESRIKSIQQLVQQASSSGTLINYSYADNFHDSLESLRQSVRQFPDY
jgi:DNA repair exonuclease SbcCD ATPase subunit